MILALAALITHVLLEFIAIQAWSTYSSSSSDSVTPELQRLNNLCQFQVLFGIFCDDDDDEM